ncbi:DEAD/DEAH box helicase [Cupriavidus taiwanensis]|uniref:Helicase, superfamily II n=1 Tax=Cupriavidus taiwanensis TaxID=164546 RepID=A0A7Z7JEP5_9BURK|nr:DEAD/DEAH box helicase [Cupriavidus taiwanensis]SOZ16382.1 Helicase, superfamily II [Cupriavidus taiwanensis]SOZ95288.1 Helicase, superfamily II [Cupriavidus taiwanensis]SPC25205.1 Helicase, superfamily II [Cupriavidus taiwanensis]SPD37780.1 Helicase, superfamily II [Cupriavidus taiwanensis]
MTAADMLAPHLTPGGHLLAVAEDAAPILAEEARLRLESAFALGAGHGLLHLGAAEIGRILPPAWAWWRDFAARYVTALCATSEGGEIVVATPAAQDLDALIADAPPMMGGEYLTPDVLATLWSAMDTALHQELVTANVPLQDFLKMRHPAWNLVGRVHFNLAENRKDPESPFAFLATYTSRLSALGKAQHQPLSQALAEFSGARSKAQLLSLLLPVQRAAEHCDWLREMVDTGEIYHPLRWTPLDAHRFLSDLPLLEAAGIVVRTPGAWQAGRPARPVVKASVGAQAPSLLGKDALLDFNMEVSLDGERLSAAEVKNLLKGADGLQLIRGRWIEVDKNKLGRLLKRFEAMEQAAQSGLPFNEALRLLAGVSLDERADPADRDWSQLVAGPWLSDILQELRQPEGLAQISPGPELKATLRPYQQAGVRWLYLLTRLGLGACLADDMGLGKTMQVLSLLLVLKRESAEVRPSLLVAPASLLANWAAEAERFAPSLRLLIAHPSVMPATELRALDPTRFADIDLVITSFGSLLRQPVLATIPWRLAIVDEAQAIKNPGAKQTRQVKQLQAQSRIALTGTPVENRLSDLWSIFDFTHPGLLGSDKVFANFTRRLAKAEHFGPLRTLVRPYILRRLKTDKRVIDDLPDKTELKAWCHLSPSQAALYQQAVKDLATALEDAEGIGRKGVVLSFLMRFKQICNHPSQWLGDGAWQADDSGKFARLRQLAEVIAAKQEKVLVFTQFRETTEPLAAFLGSIFGREGLVLHGGTPVAKRRELVKRFQEDELTPFFVLSLKAGGAGLNLTAASHVIHYDRWWNPAVENQATDRAFRIGQKRNVLVHKFICRGTIEDRIDQLIEAKQQLVQDVLEGGAELLLTEMSNRELLDLVKLDVHAAQET